MFSRQKYNKNAGENDVGNKIKLKCSEKTTTNLQLNTKRLEYTKY